MANTPAPFRQHHIRKALKAAADAGVAHPRVHVRLPSGAELTVGGAAGMPSAAVAPKPGKVRSPALPRSDRGR
jgi:hypothetical protein